MLRIKHQKMALNFTILWRLRRKICPKGYDFSEPNRQPFKQKLRLLNKLGLFCDIIQFIVIHDASVELSDII